MPQILVGALPDDGTGDTLRAAGLKINQWGQLNDKTVNAAFYKTGGLTTEAALNLAIPAAALLGAGAAVWVPASMLPYNASLVTFNNAIRMLAEGFNPSYFNVRAYGAAGNNVQDDTAAFQACATAANGGVWYVGPGNYKVTDQALFSAQTGTRLLIDAGATIIQTVDAKAVVKMDNCTNMLMEGVGTIKGNYTFTYDESPVDAGVMVQNGCENITLQDFTVTGFHSMGIWLGPGGSAFAIECRNIKVLNVKCSANGASGLYIGSVGDCSVLGGEYSRQGQFTSKAGTIHNNNVQNATAIIGIGTSFTTDFAAGDYIRLDGSGEIRYILSIADNTHMTLMFALDYPIAAGIAMAYSKVANITFGYGIVMNTAYAESITILGAHCFGNTRKGIDSHVGRRTVVSGCSVHDNAQWGLEFYPGDDSYPPHTALLVTGNLIMHNGLQAMRLGSGATSRVMRAVVSDNQFSENYGGLTLQLGKGFIVSDNVFVNHDGDACVVQSTCSDVEIHGNRFYDNAGNGLWVRGTASNIRIRDNTARWTNDSLFGQSPNGILIDPGVTGLTMSNNIASGNAVNITAPSGTIVVESQIALVSGTTPALDASLGNYFTLAVLTNIAVVIAVPTNPPAAGFSQEIIIAMRNASGGALGTAPTFNAGANGFKFSAVTNPANGTQVEYKFRWDPVQSFWYEVGTHLAAGI